MNGINEPSAYIRSQQPPHFRRPCAVFPLLPNSSLCLNASSHPLPLLWGITFFNSLQQFTCSIGFPMSLPFLHSTHAKHVHAKPEKPTQIDHLCTHIIRQLPENPVHALIYFKRYTLSPTLSLAKGS